jgi:L-iditol 2-dehydrogenase
MRSVRLFAPDDLRLKEEPIPSCGTGEQLVRVKAVGICGSDLHWFSQARIGEAVLAHPLVLGHEFAGDTESGQRVAVDPAIPCGHCEYCQRGHPNLCPNVAFAGHGVTDGALREWIAWGQKRLYPLPDSLTHADGALLEPLGVALNAVDLAGLKPGMTVGVFGCGPVGLLIVQLARISGALNIIATDVLSHRLDAAESFGAHHAFLAQGREEAGQILAATHKRGVDVAFEVAGEQDAVDTAITVVVPGGKVILAGIPENDQTSFSASTARRKGLTLKMVRRMRPSYPRAIQLVSNGFVDLRSLVTHRFPLKQAMAAFQTAKRREGLKILIDL